MKSEEKLIFVLLKMYFSGTMQNDEILHLLTDETLKQICELASKHSIMPIIASVIAENELCKNTDMQDELNTCLMMAVMKYQYQNLEFRNICKLLEESKIAHIPLKGSVMKKYYAKPWLRTSCDIDILIHPEDLDCAADVLVSNGYTLDKKGSHDIAFVSKNNVRLELHYDVIEKECNIATVNDVLLKIWDYAILKSESNYEYVLTSEMFYFYHIAHMAKHFVHGGCGIRTFLDTWILNNKLEFDVDIKHQLLKDGGILSFANAVEEVSNVWFANESETDLTKEMQFYILRGGTYGNIENHIAVQQAKVNSKLKHAFSKIFLKYDIIKLHYPILTKHKYLLPYFEVKRWCKLIFYKNDRARAKEHLIKNQFLSDDLKCIASDLLTKLKL